MEWALFRNDTNCQIKRRILLGPGANGGQPRVRHVRLKCTFVLKIKPFYWEAE